MSEDKQFEALLDFLFQTHGFDFTGYKRPSLLRRVGKRLQDLELPDFEQYLDFLQVHPEEFHQLFDTTLINVTAFFRDAPAWDYLRETAIPKMLSDLPDEAPLRVWSAGCASGEEAYSLAILFAEALGVEAFQQRVKIYATDVDDEALGKARQGVYSVKELEPLAPELRDRYFDAQGNRASFRPDLRRSVIFGRHDLVQDAPISRLDLLVCRNTLMYFTAETQARILGRLHYALTDNGVLFLGRSEMLLTHSNLFAPINLKHRVFSKVPRPNGREVLPTLIATRATHDGTPEQRGTRLRDQVFDASPVAQLSIDSTNTVLFVNQTARALFGLGQKDIGRRLQDLEVSYKPTELRSTVEEAHRERRPIRLSPIEWRQRDGRALSLEIMVTPFHDADGARLGTTIAFVDNTSAHRLSQELDRTKQELETAYEELQSTNEELETTNEELQSTVEELETTNEELQSANEELETMNEELQSTNSELQTINLELRDRGDELDRLSSVTDSVLINMHVGLIVIDVERRVLVWNGRAEDFWGLRPDEVRGRHLNELDFGLPVELLDKGIDACLRGEAETSEETLTAMNRRGRTMSYHVMMRPLLGPRLSRDGVVIVMEERKQLAER